MTSNEGSSREVLHIHAIPIWANIYGSAVSGTGLAVHPAASQQVLPGGLPTQHYRSTGSVSEPRGRQAPRPPHCQGEGIRTLAPGAEKFARRVRGRARQVNPHGVNCPGSVRGNFTVKVCDRETGVM